jgi:hypothetical protein
MSKKPHGRPKGQGAVMAGRVAAPDGLDFFPTPPWAVRAFCEFALRLGGDRRGGIAWDPACGMGHMAVPLAEYFARVHASDIYPYGFGEVGDFLDRSLGVHWSPPDRVDWIVINPPFNAAKDFLLRALSYKPTQGIALLLRTVWLESEDRWRDIFSAEIAPSAVYVSADRIPMTEGRYDPAASSATSYSWFVWRSHLIGKPVKCTLEWVPFGAKAKFYRRGDAEIGVAQARERGLL